MNLDPRLLRLVREARSALALTVGFGFAGGVLAVWQAALLSQVINGVFLLKGSLVGVAHLLGILLGVIFIRAGSTWGMEVSAASLALRVKARLRDRLFSRLLSRGPVSLRQERTGELASVAIQGIDELEAYFSQYLPQLILAVLVPLTLVFFIARIDWLSAAILLLTAPLIPLFMILIGSLAEALTRRQWQSLRRLSAYFLDVIQGLETLKLLGRSRQEEAGIERASESYRLTTMQVLRVTFLSALTLELVSTLSTAIVAVQVGLRLLYGWVTFEQAFFVLLLAPEFYLPLRMLGMRFHAGMSGAAAGQRIFELLDTLKDEPPSVQLSLPGSGVTHPCSISFQDIQYEFPDGETVLNGVNFTIPVGQTTALVGLSGAGKSTLASLLLRFLEPTRGMILAGDQPLPTVPLEDWRQQIAWVPQNPYLFQDTIAANIRLGRPQATIEEVIHAANQAHAGEFISRLPQGYNTPIGERGTRLSAGQAQRIALARAFLKDAPILILDEGTASLDPESATLVHDSLRELARGRTVILIVNEVSTVVDADQIIVLDEGRVVESGRHVELLGCRGLYAQMIEAEEAGKSSALDSQFLHPAPILSQEAEDDQPSPEPPSPFLPSKNGEEKGLGVGVWTGLFTLVRPYVGWVALSVLLGFATVGSSIGLMGASAFIISAAALQPSIATLQIAIVGVRFFGLTRGVFRYLERLVSHQTTFRILARLRVWFYRAIEPRAPARLSGYHSGDLLSRVTSDIATLENFYVRTLAPPLVAVFVTLAAAAYLYSYHPYLALVYLVFAILAGVGVPLLVDRLNRRAGPTLVESRARLSATLVDGIQGLADLLAFGQTGAQLERMRNYSHQYAHAQQRMANVGGLQTMLGGLAAHLSMWSVLFLAIPLVHESRFSGVYLAVLVLVALTSFEALTPLPQAAQYMQSSLHAARRLFELAQVPPAVQPLEKPQPLPLGFDLEVRDLVFSYPAGLDQPYYSQGDGSIWNPRVLDGLSFSLPQGKRLAIVGPSGSGKTTLLRLLLRFWEFEAGEIRLGGQSLRNLDQEELRQRIAIAPQNPYLFSATLRDNLLMAKAEASEAELVCALQQAQLDDFVQTLPQGLDTWVGEQGLRLSTGERQRLSIARALIKDAPLLILDEPCANLDAINAVRLMESILAAASRRTLLLVTHRLIEMQAMDEILVLRQGRVVERGSQAELLELGGYYRRMWGRPVEYPTIKASRDSA
jgi:ATP-binding cassette subfamily C protein CydCD